MSRVAKTIARLAMALCLATLLGCQNTGSRTPVATSIDPKRANSEYWFNLPAITHVDASDYDTLWNACEQTAIVSSFTIERMEYRSGLLSTKPLLSRQFFEIWKQDVADPYSQIESDWATHRRVAHFQISKLPDGRYRCEPKVVVERYQMSERRITGVYQYRDAFSTFKQLEEEQTDEGTPVRVDYWYAERRDPALERALALRIEQYLPRGAPTASAADNP